jgi:hypothetical protein
MATQTLSRAALEAKYRLLLSWRNDAVDFLGLPNLQDDRPVSLEAIYVGTRLTWEPDGKNRMYLTSALRQHRGLVVLGDPGSGKSTLVQMITYSLGRTEQTPLARMLGPLLPIPIVLRDYRVREWHEPADMLRGFIGRLDPEIREHATVEWLSEMLRSGRCALLLDGLDEVGSVEDRQHLRDRVVTPLLPDIGKSVMVLTSRVFGYDEVPFEANGLEPKPKPTPSGLRLCYIAPFADDEIHEYVRRWYSIRESNASRRQEGVDSLSGASFQNQRLRELASKPGLLAVMALINGVKGALPLERLKLYDKIVEVYLEATHGYRNLLRFSASLDETKQWLAMVGWEMQCLRAGSESRIVAKRSEVVKWISQTATQEVAEWFLDYATSRRGLLVSTGPEEFAFAHLSFQEYFAAWYLRGKIRRFQQLVEECARLVNDVRWHETLVLLFGMLAEFPGAGDDLLHEILQRMGEGSSSRATTAAFLVRLLTADAVSIREALREASEFVFLALVRGEIGYVAELRIFFARFAGEFETWATKRIQRAPIPEQAQARRALWYSFIRTSDLLTNLGPAHRRGSRSKRLSK